MKFTVSLHTATLPCPCLACKVATTPQGAANIADWNRYASAFPIFPTTAADPFAPSLADMTTALNEEGDTFFDALGFDPFAPVAFTVDYFDAPTAPAFPSQKEIPDGAFGYRMTADFPARLLMRGDVLIFAPTDTPALGDLCAVTQGGIDAGLVAIFYGDTLGYRDGDGLPVPAPVECRGVFFLLYREKEGQEAQVDSFAAPAGDADGSGFPSGGERHAAMVAAAERYAEEIAADLGIRPGCDLSLASVYDLLDRAGATVDEVDFFDDRFPGLHHFNTQTGRSIILLASCLSLEAKATVALHELVHALLVSDRYESWNEAQHVTNGWNRGEFHEEVCRAVERLWVRHGGFDHRAKIAKIKRRRGR